MPQAEEGFAIKDSGARTEFASGMVRDVTEGKSDYLLTRDGPMYERWAEHLTKGAKKYAKRNWMQASGTEEYERFRESFLRHAEAWLRGDRDEDHAAAIFFNVNGAEYVLERMDEQSEPESVRDLVAEADELLGDTDDSTADIVEEIFLVTYPVTIPPIEFAQRFEEMCNHASPDGWYCERYKDHPGIHAFPAAEYGAIAAEAQWPAE